MSKINETPQSNILLTGACGYVGHALIHKLGSAPLYTIDRAHDNEISQVSRKFICSDLNKLSSEDKTFLTTYIGTVIHLAAARSDDSYKKKYIDDNLNATKSFLDALNPNGIKMFIHIGLVAAIDGEILEKKGSTISSSDDWYRISKFQQQKIIELWAKENKVSLIILAPSAIYDSNAGNNMTNIGRLEKIVTFLKVVPEINVLKSLTSMSSLTDTIRYFLKVSTKNTNYDKNNLIQRFLVLDKPIMTITEICKKKFNIKFVIKIPKLKTLLFFLASILEMMHLTRKLPLSKDRVVKLFKPTDYKNIAGYKEWNNEEV